MTSSRAAARNPTYYGGDLRRDLLRAAVDVASRDGPDAVSLRALARDLGVSHAAPRNHFPDKRALFTAMTIEAYQGLAEAMAGEVAGVGALGAPARAPGEAALARLTAAGRGYARFAEAHPGHFAVMWRQDLHDPDEPQLAELSRATVAGLVELVRAAFPDGPLAREDPLALSLVAWCFAHGLAALQAVHAFDDLMLGASRTELDDRLLDLLARLLGLAASGTTGRPAPRGGASP